jgi:hypothetical protein
MSNVDDLITPRVVELWRALQRCRNADRQHELEAALDRELRLAPWQPSPFDTVDNGYCRSDGTAYAAAWPQAVALRRALDRAAAGLPRTGKRARVARSAPAPASGGDVG